MPRVGKSSMPPVRLAVSYKKFYIAVALALSAAACASNSPPTEQVAAARAMVTQAQPAAAKEAPAELNTAQTKLAAAEAAMQQGEYERARWLAEEAEVDARLAWTAGENARVQRAAAEIDQSLQTLRDELERRSR